MVFTISIEGLLLVSNFMLLVFEKSKKRASASVYRGGQPTHHNFQSVKKWYFVVISGKH